MGKKDCVFCNFKDQAVLLYEDSLCFAVISQNPINKHHVLVIPKEHYQNFTELPDELASHIFIVAKKISKAVR
jgi:histidine triad (HIT) family protein